MFRNSEGYADPTAGAACAKIAYEEKQRYRKLVYICSPYAGDIDGNTAKARRYSRFAVKQGYVPVAPHLLYPQFLKDADGEREIGLKSGRSRAWFSVTLPTNGSTSRVCSAGKKKANTNGMPTASRPPSGNLRKARRTANTLR